MADNVASLGAHRALTSDDNRLWTTIECLEEAIRDLKAGNVKADKLVVMFIDTSDNSFTVHYHSANIKASEILAGADCLKQQTLTDMGYNDA